MKQPDLFPDPPKIQPRPTPISSTSRDAAKIDIEPFDDWDLSRLTPNPDFRATSEADVWFDDPARIWNAGKG